MRPDEHWNCVVRTARFAKFTSETTEVASCCGLHPCAKAQGRKPRRSEEFPPLFVFSQQYLRCVNGATVESCHVFAVCKRSFGWTSRRGHDMQHISSLCQCLPSVPSSHSQRWTMFVTDLSCSQIVEKRACAWLKDLEHSTLCLSWKPLATEGSDHPRLVCPIQLPARTVVTLILS